MQTDPQLDCGLAKDSSLTPSYKGACVWIVLLALVGAVVYATSLIIRFLSPQAIGLACAVLLTMGWVGFAASWADKARWPERFRKLRHLTLVLLFASVPMGCSTVNYLSLDPNLDAFGFRKETPRGYVDDDAPIRVQTRGARRARMIQNFPKDIAGRVRFLGTAHGALLAGMSFIGVIPFFLAFRMEHRRENPKYWLNETYWLFTFIATILFLFLFSGS